MTEPDTASKPSSTRTRRRRSSPDELGADLLLLLTDVPAVETGWGTEVARPIGQIAAHELQALKFAQGSMAPKVAAASSFVIATGARAAIGALTDAAALVSGTTGTQVDAGATNRRFGCNVLVMSIRVFLLDDHEIVRRGVRELLEVEDDLEVVGEAGTAEEALTRIPATAPDVADHRHATPRRQRGRGLPRGTLSGIPKFSA